MKSSVKTFIIYGLLFFFSAGFLPYLIVQNRINGQSEEKNAALLRRWYETMFKVYIKRVRVSDEKVLLITEKRAEYKGQFPHQFEITEGEIFHYGFDRGTQVTFTIKDVQEDGLLLEYDFVRDYREFGQNVVVNYTAPLKLKWSKNI